MASTPPRGSPHRIDGAAASAAHRGQGAGDPAGADLQQVLLHGQHRQLLHLLPDPPLRRSGGTGAAAPVRVPGGLCRRWFPRRPAG
ncbi:hypothetical protein G6F60_015377 [Rhizopus arrhizus]|nr:hypothetical protein G6F60_015377 [Rhizopus arrhizus]